MCDNIFLWKSNVIAPPSIYGTPEKISNLVGWGRRENGTDIPMSVSFIYNPPEELDSSMLPKVNLQDVTIAPQIETECNVTMEVISIYKDEDTDDAEDWEYRMFKNYYRGVDKAVIDMLYKWYLAVKEAKETEGGDA